MQIAKVRAFLAATAHLSDEEDLALRRALDLYALRGGALPAAAEVARLTRSSPEVVARVLAEFFLPSGEGWSHPETDRDLAASKARADRARANGRNGGRPRKEDATVSASPGNPEETQSVPTGLATPPSLLPPPFLSPTPPLYPPSYLPPTSPAAAAAARPSRLDGFDEFWARYPRRVAKAVAVKAWSKIAPDPATRARILEALAAACESQQWRRDGGQFVPHPATWLNQRRWEDHFESQEARASMSPLEIALSYNG